MRTALESSINLCCRSNPHQIRQEYFYRLGCDRRLFWDGLRCFRACLSSPFCLPVAPNRKYYKLRKTKADFVISDDAYERERRGVGGGGKKDRASHVTASRKPSCTRPVKLVKGHQEYKCFTILRSRVSDTSNVDIQIPAGCQQHKLTLATKQTNKKSHIHTTNHFIYIYTHRALEQ